MSAKGQKRTLANSFQDHVGGGKQRRREIVRLSALAVFRLTTSVFGERLHRSVGRPPEWAACLSADSQGSDRRVPSRGYPTITIAVLVDVAHGGGGGMESLHTKVFGDYHVVELAPRLLA